MVAVALVGLGDIGRGAHLPALLRSPDVRWSPSPTRSPRTARP